MTDPVSNTPYIALARKYRSSHFGELIGQDTLVRTLTNAIEHNRIHHAYMLTGVRGIGKTSTARIIAKALNYVGADGNGNPTTGSTDDCPVCQAIGQDRHPDVIELDAASHTGVDDMRELIDGVRYAPVSARYKIYIIDEVHMLSKAAFNALLKTLEEPPENTVFIFATTEARKVPVTILSRCQRFDLRRIDEPTLITHYKKICDAEGATIDEAALQLIGRAADGSVRDGLSLLDQAMSQAADKNITAEMIGQMVGQADRAMIIDLFEAAMGGEAAKALDILESLHKAGAEAKIILNDLLEFTHLLTRIKMVPTLLQSESLTSVEREKGKEFSEKLSVPILTRTWQMLLKGVTEIQTAPQPVQALEMILVRLIYSADHPPLHKLMEKKTENSAASQVKTEIIQERSTSSTPAQAPIAPTLVMASRPSASRTPSLATQAQRKPDPVPQPEPELAIDPVTDETGDQKDGLNSLQDVMTLCQEKGEVLLASEVFTKVQLVLLKPGHLEFNPASGASKDLAQRLRKVLSDATGVQWIISISNKEGQSTLSAQDAIKKAQDIERVNNHPLMKKVVKKLPAFDIVAVTDFET